MIKKIKKENGKVEEYSSKKAAETIYNAMQDCKDVSANKSTATKLVHKIEKEVGNIEEISSEDFAKNAIKVLNKYNKKLSKHYKQVRINKSLNRLKSSGLMKSFKDVLESDSDDPNSINAENANIDATNSAARLHRIASETNKEYVLNYLLPPKYTEAHREKYLHIHDLDYYQLNQNCLQADLKLALENGFNTGSMSNKEPQSIMTALMLTAIVMQSAQNGQHGGIAVGNFDSTLAKYVDISFRKHFTKLVEDYYELKEEVKPYWFSKVIINKLFYGINFEGVEPFIIRQAKNKKHNIEQNLEIIKKQWTKFLKIAKKETEKETKQGVQGFMHNLNTLHSRAADQCMFSSVNFGLDTSQSGRLVSKCLMEQTMTGGGDGETFIYPISIFHVLEGINYYKQDKNYDLYKLAMKSSATRIYPNYNFLDSAFQFQYIRNKKGELLWKAKEDHYVKLNLLSASKQNECGNSKDLIHNNLLDRIRNIQSVERKLIRTKSFDKVFPTLKWIEGTLKKADIKKAHNRGAELPVHIDSLAVGLDDRTVANRMGCVDAQETITFRYNGKEYKNIPIKNAFEIIKGIKLGMEAE